MKKNVIIGLCMILLVVGMVNATNYYFSNSGSDSSTTGNITNPYKTLTKMDGLTLYANDQVLFNRGDVWYIIGDADINVTSGNSSGNITYGAYGVGERPIFHSGIIANNSANWTNVSATYGAGIWESNFTLIYDVGQIFFNGSYAQKRNLSESLTADLRFKYNYTNDKIYVNTTTNPATRFSTVILSTKNYRDIMYATNKQYIVVKDLSFQYASRHAIDFQTTSYIYIYNNTFLNIGGTYLDGIGASTTRMGNCLSFEAHANNVYAKYNSFDGCYDAALSTQSIGAYGVVEIYNNEFSYNIVVRSQYGYEYFNSNVSSDSQNISVHHNTFAFIGSGWTGIQQLNRAYCIMGNADPVISNNQNWTDNICYNVTDYRNSPYATDANNSYFAAVGRESSTVWKGEFPYINYNLGYISDGTYNYVQNGTFYINASDFTLGTGQCANCIEADPLFLDLISFQPIYTSPVCGAASDGTDIGAISCAEMAITNLAITSTTANTISITWTNPNTTTTGWNYTKIYANGYIYTNTTNNISTIPGLNEGTNYNITAVPYNNLGIAGTNSTVNATTLNSGNMTDLIITSPADNTHVTTGVIIEWNKAIYNGTTYENQTVTITRPNGTNTILSNYTTLDWYGWDTSIEGYTIGNYTLTVSSYINSTTISTDSIELELLSTGTHLIVNVYNNEGVQLTNNEFTDNITLLISQGSSMAQNIYYYLSELENTVNVLVSVTDLDGWNAPGTINLPVTRINTTFNMTLNRTYLTLYFVNESNPTNTSGKVSDDMNYVSNFTNVTTLVLTQQNLTNSGLIKVFFNWDETMTNWTQFYEYRNNGGSMTDTLELNDKNDIYMYIKVMSLDRATIKEATVYAKCAKPTQTLPNWDNYTLRGRRLTLDNGETYLWLNRGDACVIIVAADGYSKNATLTFLVGDENWDENNPYIIYLSNKGIISTTGTSIMYQDKITSKINDIKMSISTLDADRISYNTSMMLFPNVIPASSCNNLGICTFTIHSGIDFNNTNTEDITVSIYLDDVLWKDIIIEYVETNQTTSTVTTAELATLDQGILKILVMIALIFISMLIGILIKSGDAGSFTFKMGAVIAAMINTSFIGMALFIVLGFVLQKIIKRLIGE